MIHPDEVAESKKSISKLEKGYPKVLNAEKQFIHKNGSIVSIIVNAFSIRSTTPHYAVVHFLDISDRKRAENEILLKNALLDAQKEASVEGILAIDPNGKMISHNSRFAEMWKIPEKIIQTDDDSKLLHFVLSQLKKPKVFLDLVNKLYRDAEKSSQDLLEFTDGRVFSRYTSPLKDANGQPLGRIWFFRDITHEKEIDRAKSEFITIASHELRTPLSGVRWLLEAVLRRGHLTTQQAEFIRKALESNGRIINLANDLLDATSLEAGSITPAPIKTDPAKLVAKLVEEARLIAKARNQTILFDSPSKSMTVSLDPKLVSQAISNVLVNAIKYSGEGKTIAVSFANKEGKVEIHVKDQGEGMDKNEQKRIFEQFFRGKAAIHRSIQGSGLGLYLAQKFLRLCGGSIRFHSTPGKGTSVTISLPILAPMKPKKSFSKK